MAKRASGRATALLLLTVSWSGCQQVLPFSRGPGEDRGARDAGGSGDVREKDRERPPELRAAEASGERACPGSCLMGCDASGACRRLAPSNVGGPLPALCLKLTISDVAVTMDTGKCWLGTCEGQVLDSRCVIHVADLEITESGTLQATGLYPLQLIVEGEAIIDGRLDAGATEGKPGPGGAAGGTPNLTLDPFGQDGQGLGAGKQCGCMSNDNGETDDCGGGGGGHASAGGNGGQEVGGLATCGTPSAGGTAYGQLGELLGGSGGASGNNDNSPTIPGAGGAGGGALQISAQRSISIGLKGGIRVGGGGGGTPKGVAHAGGGGGGSAGTILLEAPLLLGNGWASANGGGGGGGMANTNFPPVAASEDGGWEGAAAKGGMAGGGAGGAGGHGTTGAGPAYGTNPPAAGGEVAYQAGGGGGGAAGVVRLRWYAASTSPQIQVSGLRIDSILP